MVFASTQAFSKTRTQGPGNKQKNDGKGLIPVEVVTMEEARITCYSSGGDLTSMTVAFTAISIVYYYETSTGAVEKGDTVKFDLKTGTLSSGNQAAMK